jgi:hypothetical protein
VHWSGGKLLEDSLQPRPYLGAQSDDAEQLRGTSKNILVADAWGLRNDGLHCIRDLFGSDLVERPRAVRVDDAESCPGQGVEASRPRKQSQPALA